jgi:hypothetical protein
MAADTIAFLTQGRRLWLTGRYVNCQWDVPELLARENEIVEGDKLKMRMAFEIIQERYNIEAPLISTGWQIVTTFIIPVVAP